MVLAFFLRLTEWATFAGLSREHLMRRGANLIQPPGQNIFLSDWVTLLFARFGIEANNAPRDKAVR